MLERQLQSLKDMPVPAATESAKARALTAAMEAFAATPAAPQPLRAGPRTFILHHGYKIAASLAAIAVIGPMLALWPRPPQPEQDHAAKAKIQVAPLAVSKPAAEVKLAPPAVLATPAPIPTTPGTATPATPSVRVEATRPSAETTARRADGAGAAAPQPPPAAVAAPSTSAPPAQGATRPNPAQQQPTRQATTSAPRPSQPLEALCPPGGTCPPGPQLTLRRGRSGSPVPSTTWPIAPLVVAIEGGRLPDGSSIDSLVMINAFDYPSVGDAAGPSLVIVPSPWSRSRIGFAWAPKRAGADGNIELEVRCGDSPGLTMPPLHKPVVGRLEMIETAPLVSSNSGLELTARVVGLFAIDGGSASCRTSVQSRVSPGSARMTNGEGGVQTFETIQAAPIDVRFAIALLRFADLLRGSAENAAAFGYVETIALAEGAKGADPSGERAAFIATMRKAQALSK